MSFVIDPRQLKDFPVAFGSDDQHAVAVTRSGSRYILRRVSEERVEVESEKHSGVLSGAVYSQHGPMRVGVVIVGLSIEATLDDGRVLTTSPVVRVER